MESLTYTLGFRAHVVAVEEKFQRYYEGGLGQEARFSEVSLGWFIGLERSHEWLYAGHTKPPVSIGDEAVIRINFYAKPI
jgi:hypothetical protein